MTTTSSPFAELFFKVTGIRLTETTRNEEGWFFIPPTVKLGEKDAEERTALGKFGWKNHIENDEYAGWWVKPWP